MGKKFNYQVLIKIIHEGRAFANAQSEWIIFLVNHDCLIAMEICVGCKRFCYSASVSITASGPGLIQLYLWFSIKLGMSYTRTKGPDSN